MDVLKEVKTRLQITGNYQDDMVKGWIDTVKRYLVNAGAHTEWLETESALGVISTGCFDLWTRASFSNLFKDLAVNFILSYPDEGDSSCPTIDWATEDDIDSLFMEGE